MQARCSLRLLAVVVFALMVAVASWGQALAGGSIEGTVVDGSGAVIPGTTIKATNTGTGATFVAVSNDDGLFRFPVLPVGTYDLNLEKEGFGKYAQRNIQVAVGSKTDLRFALKVASTSEVVTVNDEAPVVETTRTQVSSSVNERAIKELPVNGRNFIDFVLLTPGVTRDTRTGDISFAGQRGTLNSLTVDGADNNNTFFGQTTGRAGSGRAPYQFSQDSVQEFQVNSNAYSAELGRAGGAVINVVTKSGTNAYHGGLFWFYRDQGLNANDPIVKQNAVLAGKPIPAKSKYHFNQFGGNLGGPIVKDKLFFFFDYDGQRNKQPNVVSFAPGNVVGEDQIEQTNIDTALEYLSSRSGSYTRGLDQDTYLTKVDWNLSEKNLITGRWNRQNFTGVNFENGGATNAEEHTGNSLVKSDTLTFSATSTLTNNLLNVARFTYLRDKEPGQANSNNPEAVVRQGASSITIGRNSFSPRETTITRQQYADTITWVKGRHTLKVGADFIRDQILNYFPGNFSGAYVFNSLADFGASLNGGHAGTYAQAFAGTGTTGPETHPNLFETGLFVQDDWRVRQNLTLNFGMRWDRQGVAQPDVQNATALAAGFDTSNIPIDNNNIAPRFGFAWTPWSDGKTVVRGGYGMFYGRTPSIMYGTAHSNNGISVGTLSFTGTDVPSYPNTVCGAPVDTPSCEAPSGGTSSAPSIYVFSKDYVQPQVQQGNLSIERALTSDVSLAVSYLWVKGTHLQRTRDVNLGTPAEASIAFAGDPTNTVSYLKYPSVRPVAGFQRIAQFESNANSVYNGLTMELKKRFSHKFQGAIAYTWGHVIDDAPDATSVVPFSSGDDAKMVADPFNIAADRANGVNDQRHRFVVNAVWTLDYGRNLPSVAKAILNGWELSGIFTAQSGQPYSPLLGSDLNGDSNRQTDRLPGSGRNSYTLPANYSLDPRITRNIQVYENLRLQVFAEAFNLFNRFNVFTARTQAYSVATYAFPTPTNPTPVNPCGAGFNPGQSCLIEQNPTNAPTAYFGLPTNNFISAQRIVQLGAKVTF